MEVYFTVAKSLKQLNFFQGLISGFPPMPPIYSLGFHYSKWEKVSSQIMADRVKNFTQNNFPVDVLWMDLPYTNKGMYLDFDPNKF